MLTTDTLESLKQYRAALLGTANANTAVVNAIDVVLEAQRPKEPKEPVTFDWRYISTTPGVWAEAKNPDTRWVVITTTPKSDGIPVLFHRGLHMMRAVPAHWKTVDYTPAPEKLSDLRITFDPTDWRGLCEELLVELTKEWAAVGLMSKKAQAWTTRLRAALGKETGK